MDPEPAPSTKARAVFALGLVALLTGLFVGGVMPATIALLLARRRPRAVRVGRLPDRLQVGPAGRRLAWAGIVLALTALVVAAIAGLLHAGRHRRARTSTPTPTEPAAVRSSPSGDSSVA